MTGLRRLQGILVTAVLLIACAGATNAAETVLPIPPLLEATYSADGVARFELTAQTGSRVFIPGLTTPTMGYSGEYLGPTLRVREGEDVEITVTNDLPEMTTVHWHGLYVPAESDGGPHQTIEPGATWTAAFSVRQQAATLWYHPHPMGNTGAQVYAGLSGLLIIDDDRSEALGLPSTYGVDDIPVIIQDRRFFEDGAFAYAQSMSDVMHGIAGNILLVNGVQRPVVTVPRGVVRLRILNGSDSNVFRIRFDGNIPLVQIASDGGLLAEPLNIEASIIATGERVEVLLDTSALPDGHELSLIADDYFGRTFDAVTLRVDEHIPSAVSSMSDIPDVLNVIPAIAEDEFPESRKFAMQTMGPGGQLTINGTHMDMDRMDFRLAAGSREIWEISNVSMGMMSGPHTFHIHNGQFRLIEVNGEPPPPHLSGRKDTFLLWPNDRIRVAVAFDLYTGVYMYHCHFLVHEDAGMMGQFEIY